VKGAGTPEPGLPKDLRPTVKRAKEQGFRLSRNGGHIKITAPDGHSLPLPAHTGRGGLRKSIMSWLRTHGYEEKP
jgi:hypothetical protein